MMGMELDEDAIREIFDAIQPKLFDKILSKKIMRKNTTGTRQRGGR